MLEYDGPKHQKVIAEAQKALAEEQAQLANNPGGKVFQDSVEYAERELNNEQHHNSRLFAIDAGLDKVSLRKAYPDTSQYIIIKAQIKPTWDYDEEKQKIWVGRIEDLLINTINIPLEHRAIFEPLEEAEDRSYEDDQSPRYKVRVAFGKRSEPWVVAAEEM